MGSDELRPALADHPKHLRGFHPHLVIRILQKIRKNRHMRRIKIRRDRGNILRRPNEAQPNACVRIRCKAKQARPVRLDHTKDKDYNKLEAFRLGNFVDIDGGCAMGYTRDIENGALFLRLDDMKEFPVKI